VHTTALPPNVVDVLKAQVRFASPEDRECPALQVDEQVLPSLFVSVQVMAPLVGAERVSVHSLATHLPEVAVAVEERVKAWHDAHDAPFDDVYGPPEYM
jgi:hypothetical protein